MTPKENSSNKALIDYLLSYETNEEIVEFLANREHLLTPKLLADIETQLNLVDDESNRSDLMHLRQLITLLTAKKYFILLIEETDLNEINTLLGNYASVLVNDFTYELMQSHRHRSETDKDVAIKQMLLSRRAAQLLLTSPWPQKRLLLLNAFQWLKVEDARTYLQQARQLGGSVAEQATLHQDLIDECIKKGVEIVVAERDLGILMVDADNSDGVYKIAYLRQAMEVARSCGNIKTFAATIGSLAVALLELQHDSRPQNIEEAIRLLQQSVDLYSAESDDFGVAEESANLGNAYLARLAGNPGSNVETAIRYYQTALNIFTRKRTPNEWAKTINLLGGALSRRSGNRSENLDEAISAHQAALSVYNIKDYPVDWAKTCISLASTKKIQISGVHADNLEEAIRLNESALKILTSEQNLDTWLAAKNNLGNAYNERIWGNPVSNQETALLLYQEILNKTTKDFHSYSWALAKTNLANVLYRRIKGDPAENLELSIIYHLEALSIFKLEQYPVRWAETMNNLGCSLMNRQRNKKLENIEDAIKAHEQALIVFTQAEYLDEWAYTQYLLGNCYSERLAGDPLENTAIAEKFYQTALEVFSWSDAAENRMRVFSSLAVLRGNLVREDSEVQLSSAIAILQEVTTRLSPYEHPQQWSATFVKIGILCSRRLVDSRPYDLEGAFDAFATSLRVDQSLLTEESLFQIFFNRGCLFYEEEQWGEALADFQVAEKHWSHISASSTKIESAIKSRQRNINIYAALMYCSIKLGYYKEALTYTLSMKGRILVARLGMPRRTISDIAKTDQKIQDRYGDLRHHQDELDVFQKLAAFLKDPEVKSQISDHAVRVVNQIVDSHYVTVNQQTDDLVFSFDELAPTEMKEMGNIDDIQAIIGTLNCIYLEYVRHSFGWGLFILDAEKVHYIELANDLHVIVSDITNQLISGEFWQRNDYQIELNRIYNLIFAPAETLIHETKTIIISPVDLLNLMPFQALLNDAEQFLGEQYAFHFMPGLSAIPLIYKRKLEADNTRRSNNLLLSVACSGQDLTHALAEAKAIRHYFKESVDLFEEAAIPDAVISVASSQTFSTIHFSCHNRVDQLHPEFSGLVLASEKILSVKQIALEMRLSGAPLVVLGACTTNYLRPEVDNEGIGLSWAFLLAGASTVLTSQWPVSDAATHELLDNFYRLRERETEMNDAQVLQKAMKAMRMKATYRRRPYFWAAFQINGLP